MDEVEVMFVDYQKKTGISRRKFCELMGIKASRLRDHMSLHRKERIKAKAARKVKQVKAVKAVAEEHATAGYRNVYQYLIKDSHLVQKVGLEGVRKLMGELGKHFLRNAQIILLQLRPQTSGQQVDVYR